MRRVRPDGGVDDGGRDMRRLRIRQALELRTLSVLPPGELTTEEIGERLHVPRDSVSPRMRSLERKGFVARLGKRRNASGVHAITWGLTDAGRTRLGGMYHG